MEGESRRGRSVFIENRAQLGKHCYFYDPLFRDPKSMEQKVKKQKVSLFITVYMQHSRPAAFLRMISFFY